MEGVVYSISSLFEVRGFEAVQSENTLLLIWLFSLAGALILTRHTGTIGNLTFPLNFSAVFIGATLSNWALQNLNLPIDRIVELPMLVSMVGITIASFIMIWWLQGDGVRR
jgi:hypothetical protein